MRLWGRQRGKKQPHEQGLALAEALAEALVAGAVVTRTDAARAIRDALLGAIGDAVDRKVESMSDLHADFQKSLLSSLNGVNAGLAKFLAAVAQADSDADLHRCRDDARAIIASYPNLFQEN